MGNVSVAGWENHPTGSIEVARYATELCKVYGQADLSTLNRVANTEEENTVLGVRMVLMDCFVSVMPSTVRRSAERDLPQATVAGAICLPKLSEISRSEALGPKTSRE